MGEHAVRFWWAVAVSLAFAPGPALAFCSEPSFYESAPDAPGSYEKPRVPYCLSGYSYSGRHTCDEWEIDAYFDDVNDYIDELNDYLREANRFAEEAARFAADAYEYARCEAEDVKRQHE